jgi:hypothetical protein
MALLLHSPAARTVVWTVHVHPSAAVTVTAMPSGAARPVPTVETPADPKSARATTVRRSATSLARALEGTSVSVVKIATARAELALNLARILWQRQGLERSSTAVCLITRSSVFFLAPVLGVRGVRADVEQEQSSLLQCKSTTRIYIEGIFEPRVPEYGGLSTRGCLCENAIGRCLGTHMDAPSHFRTDIHALGGP